VIFWWNGKILPICPLWPVQAIRSSSTSSPNCSYTMNLFGLMISRQTLAYLDNTRSLLTKLQTRSFVLFPLITSNQWYGMLTIHFSTPKLLRPEDFSYFEKVVNQAAAAVYSFLLLEAETRARQEAERANQVKVKFLAMILA